jgi:glucose-fructose oxidoreductase
MEKRTSRRAFVQAAGAAGIAATLFRTPHVLGQEANAGEKRLGFCFVGIGNLCMNQLLPEIHHCKYAKPVALVSGHPDKARQQAQKHGIPSKNIYNYENYDSIKDNPEIDVVYIVLPNSMHAEYAIRAAKAGKHVLCEKPMANSSEDCRKMIAACKEAGKLLQIGYRLHFEPNNLALIQAIKSGESGKLKLIENGAGFSIGDPTQWRLKKAMAGGGCLMDIGIYALNAARYMSGEEPVEVHAMTYATKDDPRFKEVEEHCSFQLRFPSGVLASCASSYSTGLNRYTAHCTKGWAELDPALSYHGNKFALNRGHGVERPEIPDIFQFAAEMDALCESILKNEPSHAPGEEGLNDLIAIEAIYKAAESGQAVKIDASAT